MRPSPLEQSMKFFLRVNNYPDDYIMEYRFHTVRQWRFDFAWIDRMLAIEMEGGTHGYGRHNRAAGYSDDCEKYDHAALLGWTVLRFTGDMLKDGRADKILQMAFKVAA